MKKKHYIKYDEDKNCVEVHNTNSINIKCSFLNIKKGYAIYVSEVTKGHYCGAWYNEEKDIRIQVVEPDNIYIYDTTLTSDGLIIEEISGDDDFNFNNEITFIGGHTGGGTSIVTKALRHMGIFFGDDCGDINNRKPHESASIRDWLHLINNDSSIIDDIRIFKNISKLYGYKNNKINAVKIPMIYDKAIKLGEIFPNVKFISVLKEKGNFYSTKEGSEFNNSTDIDILTKQRFLIEGKPVFHLNFNKFFTDYNYFNKVLKFLGNKHQLKGEKDLKRMKEIIKFNDKVLKIKDD